MLDPVARPWNEWTGTLRAISFDGDDTLWDFESAMLHGLGCVLAEIRRRVPGDAAVTLTVQRLRTLRDAAEAEMPGATLEAIRMEGMRRAVAAAGGGDDAELEQALFDLYYHARHEAVQLYPDAQPTIEALGTRFPLAIVSNGNTDVVRFGLQARFSVALYAAEVGYAKPDPRIFHLACQRLGCAPGELLHVGDSLGSDVAGAQAAGVRAVWLNRSGWRSPSMARLLAGPRPDYTITSLQQLLALLER